LFAKIDLISVYFLIGNKILQSILKLSKKLQKLQTEDLGKITEYAMCILLDTPFEGKYKYSVESAEIIAERFRKTEFLQKQYGGCVHSGAKDPITGEINPPHDFINKNNTNKLSVKSIKTGAWKILQKSVSPVQRNFKRPFHYCAIPTKPILKSKNLLKNIPGVYSRNTLKIPFTVLYSFTTKRKIFVCTYPIYLVLRLIGAVWNTRFHIC
jgi:hypothetical protein